MIDLREELIKLQHQLRDETVKQYNRVNPFVEDITDWKEKGEFLFGKGKNITVYNTCCVVGKVQVGNNTWIGPYTALDGGKDGIIIGKHCSISSGVNIVAHDTVKWALSGGNEEYEYAPIKIGDNCFIGTNAFISKGVKIGNNCVIGAGAIVTKDIPDFSIALGVPAKIKGKVVIKDKRAELKYFK
ncbi:acetyltransferase [Candidatus Marinamargulisbacteria bacterium SCGC AG-333-B06]|nr:acetyltransferase [Candidatus Marinamargulisbacteria bacterium SCGC AG-333-B06]